MPNEYVFIQCDARNGISQKTNQPYEIRKIKLACPLTFENYQLDYQDGLQLNGIKKGDRVHVDLELVPQFNRDSRAVVTGISLVK